MVVQSNTVLFFLTFLQVAAHVQAEKTASEPRIDDILTRVTRESRVIDNLFNQADMTRVTQESEIFDNLFKQPNSTNLFWVRPPAQDGHNATRVAIYIISADIIGVDESQGRVDVSLVVSQSWLDPRLAWSTNITYTDEAVKSLRVPLNLIWSPDLTSYHALHISQGRNQDITHGIKAVVYKNGQINYFPRTRYQMSCDLDLEHFPYDNATCKLRLGLWTYNGNEVNLFSHGIFLSKNEKNFRVYKVSRHSDWSIKARYHHVVAHLECCPDVPYQEVIVEFQLKRKPTFFVEAYVVAPLMLAALLPSIHILPPDNPAKINVAVISCLGVIIMAATFVTNIPASHPPGKRPAIMTAYLYDIMLFVISIAVSCITASIAHSKHTTYRIHSCFRRLLDSCLVKKACCLGDFVKYYQEDTPKIHLNLREDQEEIMNGDALVSSHDISGEGIESVVKFLRKENNRKQLEREWYQVAMIIDRTAAIAFVLLLIIDVFI